MIRDPLHQFAKQLQIWITEDFKKKPGPFKSVEYSPTLLFNAGDLSASIVFWVNRESHLAGGVILLPKDDPAKISDSGLKICSALGLDSYYTWGPSEISAWKVEAPSGRVWSEPIPDTAMHDTDTFKDILTLLLQNMQNRFFKDQQHLPKLSAPYLANLLHNCIESSLPTLALNKIRHVDRSTIACAILQILALHNQSLLPEKTCPDNLINDLHQQLGQLPAPLSVALRLNKIQDKLPATVVIKLHHLYQRLQQLGQEVHPFIQDAIKQLLISWSETAQLSALPKTVKKHKSTLIINPDRYYPDMSVSFEIAAPPLTAATALLRFLQSPQRRHPYQLSDILDLTEPVIVDEVIGSLNHCSIPPKREQANLNTLLRQSWPNRHLKLDPSTPRWVWRAIHLIGFLGATPSGTLNIPNDWLWMPYGNQFFTLFAEHFEFNRITPTTNNQVQIKFNRSTNSQHITIDSMDKNVRLIDRQNQTLTRADILLAICLPSNVYDLVRSEELKSIKNLDHQTEAVELFLRSSLGRGFWQILSQKKQIPKREKLVAEIIRTELPLPGPKILNALSRLKVKHKQPDTAAIDRELEAWLGDVCRTNLFNHFGRNAPEPECVIETDKPVEVAARMIKTGEILSFPENYLYDIPEKLRRRYTIPGPLSIHEAFFDNVTLHTRAGDVLQVQGVAVARALRLISTVQTGDVELPIDESLVETILARYLRDLMSLYEQVEHFAAHLSDSGKKTFVSQVWKNLPVPPRPDLDIT
jgi:hypothetical protein